MKIFALLALFGCSLHVRAQNLSADIAAAPGSRATIFAPGAISNGLNNRDFTISPNGTEIFYTIQSPRFLKSTIIYIQKQNGSWQKPQIAPFSGLHRDLEAFFSPDGETIFFASDRPVNGKDSLPDFDIWKVGKTNGKWGTPVHLGNNVNTEKNEFYPSVAKSGSLYFTAQPVGGYGEEDIVKCAYTDGKFQERELLDTAINTKGDEFNAFIDPDENFIIFSSYKGRKDEQGGGDLYISKKINNKWQTAVNMGSNINSPALDYCPFVTWDKKKIFFASNRNTLRDKTAHDYIGLIKMLSSSGNTSDDIYCASFLMFNK